MIQEAYQAFKRWQFNNRMAFAQSRHALSNVGITEGALGKLIPFLTQGRELPARNEFKRLADDGYRKNAIIYACVRELSATAAEPELGALQVDNQGESTELDRTHPLSRLLREPNADQDAFEFTEQLVTHLYVAGNAFIWKIRPRPESPPVALELIRPDIMGILPGKTRDEGKVKSYVVDVNGKKFEIPAQDIIHIKLPDALDEFWGLSPIFVMAQYGDIDAQATDFLRAFFFNRGIPAGIIKVNKVIQQSDRERIKEQWRDQAQGLLGWHSISVLDQDYDYKPLSTGLKDLALEPVLNTTEIRICMAYRVPPILIGAKVGLDRSTFSNFAEARASFWTDTVTPMYTRLERRLTRMLAREFGEDLVVRYDLTKVTALQEDQEGARRFAIEGWKEGLLTRNEAFAQVEMAEQDDGDVYRLATTVVIVPRDRVTDLAFLAGDSIRDTVREGQRQGEDVDLATGDTINTVDQQMKEYIWERLKGLLVEGKLGADGPNEEQAMRWHEDTSAEVDAWLAEWFKRYKHLWQVEGFQQFADEDPPIEEWQELHKKADKRIKRLMDVFQEAVEATGSNVGVRDFLDALAMNDIPKAVEAIPWDGQAGDILARSLPDVLGDLIEDVGQDTIQFIPSELVPASGFLFDFTNPQVQNVLEQQVGNLIKGLSDEQQKMLANVVGDIVDGHIPFEDAVDVIQQHIGLNIRQSSALSNLYATLQDGGLSSDEINTALKKANKKMLDFRAEMIARTESINAAAEGQRLGWLQMRDQGILPDEETRRFWIVTPDDRLDQRVCAPIPALNPNGVRLDEPFTTPAGATMSPTVHPMCRCAVGLVFKDVDGNFIGPRPGFDDDGNPTDLDDTGRAVVDRVNNTNQDPPLPRTQVVTTGDTRQRGVIDDGDVFDLGRDDGLEVDDAGFADLGAVEERLDKFEKRNFPQGTFDEFTQDQYAAWNDFKGAGYRDINDFLRGDPLPDTDIDQVNKFIGDIDASFDLIPGLKDNTRLYRGLATEGSPWETHLAGNPDDLVGTVFTSDSYISFSLSSQTGSEFMPNLRGTEGNVLFELTAKAGEKYMPMGPIVEDFGSIPQDNEQELVAGRGSQFRILEITTIQDAGVRGTSDKTKGSTLIRIERI